MKQLLIGGQALMKIGNDRSTNDTDYLIFDSNSDLFVFDKENNIDYINAAKNDFFAEIWKLEENSIDIASPRGLMELKAYSLVMHCRNFNFAKADAAEYDMKFLARKYNLGVESVSITKKHVSSGEFSEIEKIITNLKK